VSQAKALADLDYLESRSKEANAKQLQSFASPYDACHGAHAIAVLTEWDEFKTYDWQKIYDGMQKPAFVFDGRNLLHRAEMEAIGFVYQGIGS
jgi:UDPglucose 6-dehydrogenase